MIPDHAIERLSTVESSFLYAVPIPTTAPVKPGTSLLRVRQEVDWKQYVSVNNFLLFSNIISDPVHVNSSSHRHHIKGG